MTTTTTTIHSGRIEPAVADAEVRAKIADLTAGYQLDGNPDYTYTPDVWANERSDPHGYVPAYCRDKTAGLVCVYLANRADVDRMAEMLGAEVRNEDRVTVLTDPDDWYVTRTRRIRVEDWLTGITLTAQFEEGRIAPAPKPSARRARRSGGVS